MQKKYIRPPLKWPGNKFRILHHILPELSGGKMLLEPFVGSGSVFLNSSCEHYVLADTNAHLINLYQYIQNEGLDFIKYAKSFFIGKNRIERQYYKLREEFNNIALDHKSAALFLYLNRHGYNGLCRYNLSGEYNVPFGFYASPYFPQDELEYFYQKSKNAKFLCQGFEKSLEKVEKNTVVYCDPPYAPLAQTSNFTSYSPNVFGESHQVRLAQMAEDLRKQGVKIILSNHDTIFTRKIYSKAKITQFNVARFINCKGDSRKSVGEILAVF